MVFEGLRESIYFGAAEINSILNFTENKTSVLHFMLLMGTEEKLVRSVWGLSSV